jgi:hypothetical protein
MPDKTTAILQLRNTLHNWEVLLARLNEAQITARKLPAGLSIQDTLAHLRAWQALSIERLEAALHGTVPTYAGWPKGIDPDDEQHRDRVNDWILENHRDWPWAAVHRLWLVGFHRFIDLAGRIPETELLDPAKVPWLRGYTLMDGLTGSYEHHQVDHLEPILAWLKEHPHGLDG